MSGELMQGYWARSFIASNGVTVSLNSLGDLHLYKGVGDAGVTVPFEDVALGLGALGGFTQEDVELLRRCADGCDGTMATEPDERVFPDGIVMRMKDVDRLTSMAARISALLPPETPPHE